MNAVDTNILIYRFDQDEPTKLAIARRLLGDLQVANETVLLWQVLGELLRQLHVWRHKGLLNAGDVARLASAVRRTFPLVMPVERVVDRAMGYSTQFSLSHWDSMLVAACAEAGVDTLFTEDMGAPRTIDIVKLVNPF